MQVSGGLGEGLEGHLGMGDRQWRRNRDLFDSEKAAEGIVPGGVIRWNAEHRRWSSPNMTAIDPTCCSTIAQNGVIRAFRSLSRCLWECNGFLRDTLRENQNGMGFNSL